MTTLDEWRARNSSGAGTQQTSSIRRPASNIFQNIIASNAAHFPSIAEQAGIEIRPELASPTDYYSSDNLVADRFQNPLAQFMDTDGSNYQPMSSGQYMNQYREAIREGGIPSQFLDETGQTIFEKGLEDAVYPLERIGRVLDIPAGSIRDAVDIGLQRIRTERIANQPLAGINTAHIAQGGTRLERLTGDLHEWAARTNRRLATGGQGEDVRFESYIDVLNRYYYGSNEVSGRGIVQSPNDRGRIIAAGLIGDVVIDPLHGIGRLASLGAKGEQLLRLNKVFDEVGLKLPQNRTMQMLSEAQMQTGRTVLDESSPLFRAGQNLEQEFGTLAMGTPAQQARRGQRGLFSILKPELYDTNYIPSAWERYTQPLGRGRFTTQYVPVGGQILAPALEALEKKGVTDAWTFMDMVAPSAATRNLVKYGATPSEARSAVGFARRGVLDAVDVTGIDLGVAGVQATQQGVEAERHLRTIATSIATGIAEQRGISTKSRAFSNLVNETRQGLDKVLKDYAEITAVRGSELETFLRGRGIEGELPSVDKASGYVPGAAIPLEFRPGTEPITKLKGLLEKPSNYDALDYAVREFDPLNLPLPPEFENQIVRDLIENLRASQKGYIAHEMAAGLRTAELNGEDALAYLENQRAAGKITEEEMYEGATAYLYHRTSREAWEFMRNEGWLDISPRGSTGWKANNKLVDAYSGTLKTREYRGTTESFNAIFRKKHGVDFDFFDSNPAKIEAARFYESQRRIAVGRHYGRMADNLGANPAYRIQPDAPTPKGWVRLSEIIPARSWESLDPDGVLARKMSGIMIPEQLQSMVLRQHELLQNPDYLRGFSQFMKLTTNWWKVNQLGIFPAYHIGNFVSNLNLLWLGGMNDPLMIPLAAKIASGRDGVVKSQYTGREWTFQQLRDLAKGAGVDTGYFKGSLIDEAVEGVDDFTKQPGGILEGYFENPNKIDVNTGTIIDPSTGRIQPDAMQTLGKRVRNTAEFIRTSKPQDIAGGIATALTGIDSRGLNAENWAAKLMPGGQEFIGNRIGFALGGSVETNARMSMFLHAILNEGYSPADAVKRVNSTLFDYSKKESWKQFASMILPFYEFVVQNTVFQALSATQSPAKVAMTYRALNQTLPAIQGDVPEEGLPPWRRGKAFMRWNSDIAIDITRAIPTFDIPANMAHPEMIGSANPFFDTGLALALNLDLFTNQPINKLEDTGLQSPEQMYNSMFKDKEFYNIGGYPIEISPTLNHVLSNMSRLYSTLERQKWVSTALPVNVEQINYGRSMYFDKRDTEAAIKRIENTLSPHALRNRSPEMIDANRQELVKLYSTNVQQLLTMYQNNEDFEGNPLPYYTKASGETDQFDVLDEAGDQLVRTMAHARQISSFPAEDQTELMTSLWGAWADVQMKKINHLMVGARTSITPQEQSSMYNRALEEIKQAVNVSGIGPHSYIAFRNEYSNALDEMIREGIVPRTYRYDTRGWKKMRMDSFAESNAELEAFAAEMINSTEDR